MKSITSRTNPLIKHIASLQHKKYRMEHGQFCAEGERTCATLIKSNLLLLNAFVTDTYLAMASQYIPHDRIITIPPHIMEKISSSETPSGILCQFAIPKDPDPKTLTPGIVLARIADPGNMGTLIRTAAALNFKSVVIIEGTDPWSPKVVQASAGTIGMVTIFPWDWQNLMAYKKDYRLYALVVAGGKHPSTISLDNALFAIGSEAHGIPIEWVAQCDQTITLPMPGTTESLNAAIAGSIVLYLAYQSQ
jgi:TrmH family RNA methyltransferase